MKKEFYYSALFASFLLVLYLASRPKKKEKRKGGKAKKYTHIDFKPTKGMVAAAKRGIKLRKKYGKGGLTTKEAGKLGIGSGYQRALDIAEGQELSPKTVKMMKTFFSRHSAFKKHHKETPPSKALISWLLWGDNAGERWSKKIVRQMDAVENKK